MVRLTIFRSYVVELSAVSFQQSAYMLTPDRCLIHAPGVEIGLHVVLNFLAVLLALPILFLLIADS
jgi:hypothetical protein